MTNSWPDGKRHPLSQSEHDKWNAAHYPGTRQLCVNCDAPTGRCEDDSLFFDGHGPLCVACWSELEGLVAEQERADDAAIKDNLDI